MRDGGGKLVRTFIFLETGILAGVGDGVYGWVYSFCWKRRRKVGGCWSGFGCWWWRVFLFLFLFSFVEG